MIFLLLQVRNIFSSLLPKNEHVTLVGNADDWSFPGNSTFFTLQTFARCSIWVYLSVHNDWDLLKKNFVKKKIFSDSNTSHFEVIVIGLIIVCDGVPNPSNEVWFGCHLQLIIIEASKSKKSVTLDIKQKPKHKIHSGAD